ncbi:MAG: hypothetical protein ACU826_08840 [Gammaproteobacteria bacterium]
MAADRSGFSRKILNTKYRSKVLIKNGKRGIWQRHFREHCICADSDYRKHVDDVHVNPLNHGHFERVIDRPDSTFHRYAAKSVYPVDWRVDINAVIEGGD